MVLSNPRYNHWKGCVGLGVVTVSTTVIYIKKHFYKKGFITFKEIKRFGLFGKCIRGKSLSLLKEMDATLT